MLPPVLKGSRRTMFRRLLLSGLAQAAIALACSGLLAMVLTGDLAAGMLMPIAGLVLAAVATIVLRRLEAAEAERLGQSYVTEVRLALFEATLHDGESRQRHGIAMARMITDLASLKNWVSLGMARALVAVLALSGGLAALWVASPGLAPWGSALVLALLIAAGCLAIPLRSRIRTARRYRGRLAARVGELTRASDTLHQFGAAAEEAQRVRRISTHMADALAERRGLVGLMQGLPEMIVPLAAALFVAAAMADPDLSRQQPAVALLVLAFAAQPLRDLVGALDHRLMFVESRRRLAPLLAGRDLEARHTGQGAARAEAPDLPRVEIRTQSGQSLDTSAPRAASDTAPVRVVEAGRVTALPVADLAAAADALRATSGLGRDDGRWRISVDGEPLDDWSPAMRRARIQLVSPSLPLLRRSVERNLRDVVPGAGPEEIAAALRDAGLADERALLALGRRKLGELGRGLPPCVAARLRLARALLARPRIITTDDLTFLTSSVARAALERAAERRGIAVLIALPAGMPLPGGWGLLGDASDNDGGAAAPGAATRLRPRAVSR